MSSGLTYAGVGLGLFIFAALVQSGSQASIITTPSQSAVQVGGIGPAPQPVQVSDKTRIFTAATFAFIAGIIVWVATLLSDFTRGQSAFIGLLAALVSGAIGYQAAPAIVASERANPSGFKKG